MLTLTAEKKATLLTEALPSIRIRKGLKPVVGTIGKALLADLASGGRGSVTSLLSTLFHDNALAKEQLYEAFSRIRQAKPVSVPTADPQWQVTIDIPEQTPGDERLFTFALRITPIVRDGAAQDATDPLWLQARLRQLLVHASPVVGFAPLTTMISVHTYSQSLRGEISFKLQRWHPDKGIKKSWVDTAPEQEITLDEPGVYEIGAQWRDRSGGVEVAVLDPELGGRSVITEKLNDSYNIDVIPEVGDLNTVFRFQVSGEDKQLGPGRDQAAARYLWSIGPIRVLGGTNIFLAANEQWVLHKEHFIRFLEPGVHQIVLQTAFLNGSITFGTAWAVVCDHPATW